MRATGAAEADAQAALAQCGSQVKVAIVMLKRGVGAEQVSPPDDVGDLPERAQLLGAASSCAGRQDGAVALLFLALGSDEQADHAVPGVLVERRQVVAVEDRSGVEQHLEVALRRDGLGGLLAACPGLGHGDFGGQVVDELRVHLEHREVLGYDAPAR